MGRPTAGGSAVLSSATTGRIVGESGWAERVYERGGALSSEAEREARRALNRLRRALEKGRRELEAVRGAIRHAEGTDFPASAYEDAEASIDRLIRFVEEEGERLQEKILRSGGLEPGRVRRSTT